MAKNSSARSVMVAARKLIRAFSRHDRTEYFRAFSPDARFIFHTHSAVLPTRMDYEKLWARWEIDLGFKVLGCASSEQSVQMLGNTAIFQHRVVTTIGTKEGVSQADERETIVFMRTAGGKWLAVHEHLSPTHHASDSTHNECCAMINN